VLPRSADPKEIHQRKILDARKASRIRVRGYSTLVEGGGRLEERFPRGASSPSALKYLLDKDIDSGCSRRVVVGMGSAGGRATAQTLAFADT
jgi:hypothetical protein